MEKQTIRSKASGILRNILNKPETVPTPGEEPKPAEPATPAEPTEPNTSIN